MKYWYSVCELGFLVDNLYTLYTVLGFETVFVVWNGCVQEAFAIPNLDREPGCAQWQHPQSMKSPASGIIRKF